MADNKVTTRHNKGCASPSSPSSPSGNGATAAGAYDDGQGEEAGSTDPRCEVSPLFLENNSLFTLEESCKGLAYGIDEVGRAPLAGPVTAACIYIPPDEYRNPIWADVTDSKKLTRKKRESLFESLIKLVIYGIGEALPEEISHINIHNATLLAMKRAHEAMCHRMHASNFKNSMYRGQQVGPPALSEIAVKKDIMTLEDTHSYTNDMEFSSRSSCPPPPLPTQTALVDGRFPPDLVNCTVRCFVKGDALCKSIGAASILAKVTRDRYMSTLAMDYPYYDWQNNAGYPTPRHIEGLKKYGPTIHHRRTFSGVRHFYEEKENQESFIL